ncbi:HNH endonuclease [Acinetobacter towneri]|uniref:HNH endonuclease n=1 Tax=Acinetobacter towneri TaxID=202956 RepID=UPI002575DD5E|nr:HNH endonuclease signature motif containing protein [Acinetobacter towneri]MDM1737542.1 HNH endonuclease [Acinetobacter towneri]
MKRLAKPNYDFGDVIDLCIDGIANTQSIKMRITSNKVNLLLDANLYDSAINQGVIYTYSPLIRFHDKMCIRSTKDDYEKLYTQYFVPTAKKTRVIYDEILTSAKGDCPFCGGIGDPTNLDHFLPKAEYPQFSIYPSNLVPSCRDCNMGAKKVGYAKSAEEQTIHPYLDKQIFFEEQWITADYIADSNLDQPGEFRYYVNAPSNWTDIDKARVEKYFDDFKLASRYAKQATSSLKSKLRSIKRELDRGSSIQEIIDDVIQPDIDGAPFVNYWEVGMCDALINYLHSEQRKIKNISLDFCV